MQKSECRMQKRMPGLHLICVNLCAISGQKFLSVFSVHSVLSLAPIPPPRLETAGRQSIQGELQR